MLGRGRLGTVLGVAATIVATSAGAQEAAARLQSAALAGSGAWRLVESLTTEVGHRFAGSPGDRAAIVWADAKLRSLGFPKVWTEPVTVPRWVRGEARAEIVAPWPQPLEALALGGSVGTASEGVEAEVVAVDDLDDLAALEDEKVAGRIVFLKRRMRRSDDGSGYGDVVAIRSRGASAAGRRGAVAVVIRSVGTDPNRLPHTGALRYAEDAPKIPAAALSAPDADLLERQLASGRPVRLKLVLGSRLEGEAESANVLAEVAGSERPGEIVLLVAHLDSWDVGTGAQDDGAGVALAVEAARLAGLSAATRPRRTIRVLLTANEEFGLSGARAYAAAHASEASQHVVAIEADTGAGRVIGFRTRFLAADAAAADELAQRLAPLGIPPELLVARGGADLTRLRPFGVPLVDLHQDTSAYFDLHHTANDTLDKIDPAALRHATAAFVTVVDWAANRESRLGSLPPEPATP
jgi:hypothetical protein